MTGFSGRYLFVAGLHRTGTSLISKLIAEHDAVAAIEDSPAPENEGCYLQGAIPHTALHGRPGHYATDPAQHHVEESRFDTLASRQRIAADWEKWFTDQGIWRVEKSPVNLTRMRLYQQLFPLAQFVIVLRHPAVMAAALSKWTDVPASDLIGYALHSYELAEADARYLHCALTVRYEDLVKQPQLQMKQLFAFIGLENRPSSLSIRNGNSDYPELVSLNASQSERAARWGYQTDGSSVDYEQIVNHPLRATRDTCKMQL